MNPKPFAIDIPQEQLEDLKRRLGAVRLPASLDAESWDDGTSLAFIEMEQIIPLLAKPGNAGAGLRADRDGRCVYHAAGRIGVAEQVIATAHHCLVRRLRNMSVPDAELPCSPSNNT